MFSFCKMVTGLIVVLPANGWVFFNEFGTMVAWVVMECGQLNERLGHWSCFHARMIVLALTVSLWQSGKVQPRNSEARFDSGWTQLPGSVPQSYQSDWCVVYGLTKLFYSKARDVLTVDVVLVVIGLVRCSLIIINTEKITVFIVILSHKVLRCAHILKAVKCF